jgi:hypothetical protein
MEYRAGDRVRMKKDFEKPKYGWGEVKQSDVGIVKKVLEDGDLIIDFPKHSGWRGYQSEMEPAEAKEYKKGSLVLITGPVLKGHAKLKTGFKVGVKVMVDPGKKACGGDGDYKGGFGEIVSVNSCSSDKEFPYKVQLESGRSICIEKDALEAINPIYWFDGKASGIIRRTGEKEGAVKIRKCPTNKDLEGEVIKVPLGSLDDLVKKVHPLSFDHVNEILVWEKFIMQSRTGGELIDSDGEGCYTDGKKIFLPHSVDMAEHIEDVDSTIFDNPNLTLYVGLMLHEIAHIRYDSFKLDMEEYIEKIRHKEAFKSIMNILEDNRIESCLQREFKKTDYERILDETRTFLIEKVKLPENPLSKLLLSYHLKLTEFNYKGIKFIDKQKHEALDKSIDGFLEQRSPLGRKSYRAVVDEIFELSKEIKNPGKTVLDSLRIAKKIYDRLGPLFEKDESWSPQKGSGAGTFTAGGRDPTSDHYEKGEIKVTPKNIDSKELEEKVKESSESGGFGEGGGTGKEPGKSSGSGGEAPDSENGEKESLFTGMIKAGLMEKGYDKKRADEIAEEVEKFMRGDKK